MDLKIEKFSVAIEEHNYRNGGNVKKINLQ